MFVLRVEILGENFKAEDLLDPSEEMGNIEIFKKTAYFYKNISEILLINANSV